jgi:hypothetical protein
MKLRFAVNQAESFRRGINAPKSLTVIEVNPSDLPKDIRNLIADHLQGIDVLKYKNGTNSAPENGFPPHVMADEPNLNSLILALKENQNLPPVVLVASDQASM